MGHKPHLCVKFHKAVELIGGRWTGALIHLLLNGRMRFAELRGAVPDISDRMLSERLRELETEGIVARIVVPETPVRVEYELTDKGRALEQALGAVGKWAERWVSDPPPAGAAAGPTRAARQSAKASRPAAAAPLRARR
jgi:DNA-binding HxlR family transcriptional regulator